MTAMTLELPEDRLSCLLSRLFGECLSSVEWEEFSGILRNSAAARQQYRDYVDVHGMLHWRERQAAPMSVDWMAVDQSAARPEPISQSSLTSRLNKLLPEAIEPATHPISFTLVSLALTLVGIACFYGMVSSPWNSPKAKEIAEVLPAARYIAEVSGHHECEFTEEQQSIVTRSRFLAEGQEIHLASGLLEITFDDGAVVVLEGPTEFIVEGRKSSSLLSGRLIAYVPASSIGFTATTPHAKVVDLGTRFGISVEEETGTKVQIQQGRVEIHSEGLPTKEWLAGSAVHIDPTGLLEELPADLALFASLQAFAKEQRTSRQAAELVLYYPFDDRSANDLSGNDNHGELMGQVDFSDDVPAAVGQGQCLSLEKNTASRFREETEKVGRIQINHSSSLAISDIMAVSFWVKGELNAEQQNADNQDLGFQHFLARLGDGHTAGWAISQHGSSMRLHVRADVPEHTNQTFQPSAPILDGQWHHLLVQWGKGQLIVWIDGQLYRWVEGYENGSGFANEAPIFIGASHAGGDRPFRGKLDEVAIFSGIVLQKQVQQLASGMSPVELDWSQ